MSSLDHPRDRRSRHPLHLPLARSPEPGGHAFAEAEAREAAVLRALLSRRREGAFVDAEEMNVRLAGMIADKRCAPLLDGR